MAPASRWPWKIQRLRGAGNILGESQTGHMNRLGLDLFLEMLEEAVAKLKGEPVQSHPETELSIGVPAFIPETYMRKQRAPALLRLALLRPGRGQPARHRL